MGKIVNLEEILNTKNLHSYYYPNGDFKQKMLHDLDCPFCKYEEEVLEAMKEACRQVLELATENARTKTSGTHDGGFDVYETIVNRQSILDTIKQVE